MSHGFKAVIAFTISVVLIIVSAWLFRGTIASFGCFLLIVTALVIFLVFDNYMIGVSSQAPPATDAVEHPKDLAGESGPPRDFEQQG